MDNYRKISVCDLTMRLCGDVAGKQLSFREKVDLAQMLDRLGVSVIETSPITNGRSDSLLIKSLGSVIKNSILSVPVDIAAPDSIDTTWEALKHAVHPRMQVSVPVSTVQMEYFCHKKPAGIIQLIDETIRKCAALCAEVEFVAKDFTRSDKEFLQQAISAAVAAGAAVVTVSDATGNSLPDEFMNKIAEIKSFIPKEIKLGVFCDNQLSLADSCTIAAVRAGADEVKTAAEGSSITSFENFVKVLNAKADVCKACCDVKMTELSKTVSQIRNLCNDEHPLSPTAPEGVHIDQEGIRLTAHDNLGAVLNAVARLGYELDEEDCRKVHETVVRIASANGSIGAKELDAIVASVAFQVPPTYRLESFVINSGNIIAATCHIRLSKGESILESVCVGDGPVDAAFLAMEKVIGRHYELDDFQIRSVAEGREAMGETVVRLRVDDKIYSGRGISTDIVGSSVMAYLNAVNKIAYEEEQV